MITPHPSTPGKLCDWDYPDLEEFLQAPTTHENRFWDFKENLGAKESTRKAFSSFANNDGGFVFYGVSNSIKAIGIKKSAHETNDWIKDVVDEIKPPISYELLHTIKTPKNTYIHVFFISGSLPDQKPHMADGFIYIRRNGKGQKILSGIDLKKHFLSSSFSPDHILQIEYEVKRIWKNDYKLSEIDATYLRRMKQFIEEQIQTGTSGYDSLLRQFIEIEKHLREIHQKRAKERTLTDIPPIQDSDELKTQCSQTQRIIEEFLESFRRNRI